ncbi:hypothetical protein E3N88_24358 [Mikania micrantha]|uniref:Reverse transcriptase domain-containing protein n=1 Tax=Mikania micrantha TaxID=192012 RepID=A0A5N6N3C7_9ASTR|nr:hypothetical protein E3N88_24358 [Mikania micrantha]
MLGRSNRNLDRGSIGFSCHHTLTYCPKVLAEFVASAPLTPLLKPDKGIRPIAVGGIWRRLVSKVAMKKVGKEMTQYLGDYQFGVGMPNGAEAVLHSANRFLNSFHADGSLALLTVDFSNAFNMVDRTTFLQELAHVNGCHVVHLFHYTHPRMRLAPDPPEQTSNVQESSTRKLRRTKHISIKYHYIRSLVEAKEMELEACDTHEQVADIFTKALGVEQFSYLRAKLGVTIIRGDEAKWLRKIMVAYLGPDAFSNRYIVTTQKITHRHIQNHWQGQHEVKVFETVKSYLFELPCGLFLSLEDPNQVSELGSLFKTFLKGLGELPFSIPGTRFYPARNATNAIKKQLMVIIKQRRQTMSQENASSFKDLLSHLLSSSDENGRFLSEIEITNNIMFLLFAGHDTSAVLITLLMKCLGEHPQIYENVLKEQLGILEGKSHDELLNWSDIQKMRYSWNVVCEVLRLTPPVIGAFREALMDFEYAGYTIPKGWKIIWSAVMTHKEEENFPNVTNFDPSRFEGAGPTPFTYVPFGGGQRMCLGKELARVQALVFLHNIVRRFNWDLLIPNEKIEYDPMATPVKGLPV